MSIPIKVGIWLSIELAPGYQLTDLFHCNFAEQERIAQEHPAQFPLLVSQTLTYLTPEKGQQSYGGWFLSQKAVEYIVQFNRDRPRDSARMLSLLHKFETQHWRVRGKIEPGTRMIG